jgi:hypothetical protein
MRARLQQGGGCTPTARPISTLALTPHPAIALRPLRRIQHGLLAARTVDGCVGARTLAGAHRGGRGAATGALAACGARGARRRRRRVRRVAAPQGPSKLRQYSHRARTHQENPAGAPRPPARFPAIPSAGGRTRPLAPTHAQRLRPAAALAGARTWGKERRSGYWAERCLVGVPGAVRGAGGRRAVARAGSCGGGRRRGPRRASCLRRRAGEAVRLRRRGAAYGQRGSRRGARRGGAFWGVPVCVGVSADGRRLWGWDGWRAGAACARGGRHRARGAAAGGRAGAGKSGPEPAAGKTDGARAARARRQCLEWASRRVREHTSWGWGVWRVAKKVGRGPRTVTARAPPPPPPRRARGAARAAAGREAGGCAAASPGARPTCRCCWGRPGGATARGRRAAVGRCVAGAAARGVAAADAAPGARGAGRAPPAPALPAQPLSAPAGRRARREAPTLPSSLWESLGCSSSSGCASESSVA